MMKNTKRQLQLAVCLLAVSGSLAASAAVPTTPQGYAKAKEFDNIGGTAIVDLTGNSKFPDRPDLVGYPTYFEWPQATPPDINTPPAGDVRNNYGVQIAGYFYPTETKAYTFYICADDNAELWLSTDETPAKKVRIAVEPVWNNPRDYSGIDRRPAAENVSAAIPLTKGKAYYIEALMKEGGGGDNLSVSIDASLPIPGSMLSPFGLASAPTILAQPQEAFVFASGTASFSVGFDVPPPATLTSIKWQKNGTDIPDSNSASISLVAAAGDNGAKIKAVISTSAGTLTSSEAVLTVASFTTDFAAGVVKAEYYHGISGTAVNLLVDDPKFPNSPDNVQLLGALETPNGYGDNYGARVTGFIVAQATGSYNFFIRSDDASAFYLSSSETAPDISGTPACEETGCCNAFREPVDGEPRTSAAISLVQGKKYAFVAMVKEGGGGDFLQVAMRKVGDTTAAAALTPISGAWIGANAKPSLGAPQITKQPQGIPQLLQGRSAELSIQASVIPVAYGFPVQVQWRKNGAAIPGATGLTYAIASASAADTGTYSAVATAPSGQSVTSSDAVVTYAADTFAPKVSKVQASSLNSLIVVFDESLDAATAGNKANYSLSAGATVSTATASSSSVLLTTSSLTAGASYTLTLGGVKDLFGNTVSAGTTITFKVNVVTYADVILADGPVMFYRFEESTGQKTKNLGTAGAAADGLWMTGAGPDDSTPANASSGDGPRPGDFLGFATDNRSGKFTGPTDLLWVDAQQQLLNNLPSFSLEYWVKPANRVADPGTFGNRIGIVGQNDAVEYGFINPNTIQIWTPGGGSLDTPYSFPDGTWHHVATIGDGKSVKNYFDGKFVNQATATASNYGSSTYNVHVGGGGAFDATGNHFTGEIDEVAIFAKAIPAERIAAHFKAGKEGGSFASDPATLKVARTAAGLSIEWQGGGVLESAAAVTGPWVAVSGAASPYSAAASGSAQYYRVSQ